MTPSPPQIPPSLLILFPEPPLLKPKAKSIMLLNKEALCHTSSLSPASLVTSTLPLSRQKTLLAWPSTWRPCSPLLYFHLVPNLTRFTPCSLSLKKKGLLSPQPPRPPTTYSLLHPLPYHHLFRPLWLLVAQAPYLPSLLLLLLLHRKRQILITKRIILPHSVRFSFLTHTLLQHAPRTFPAATHISITLSATRPMTPGNL